MFRESGQLGCRGVDLGDERCGRQRCLVGGVETRSRSVHTERPRPVLIALESVACGLGEGAPFNSPLSEHSDSSPAAQLTPHVSLRSICPGSQPVIPSLLIRGEIVVAGQPHVIPEGSVSRLRWAALKN